uniref:Cytosol aminopeptidase domain-containing protein n=1 Tax=Aureoumbra lagunensis TaxID=44058 RepID=A0A6S8DSG1_9STRA|mmetsp:Transcript_14312/g.19120  ORF Transcript_14312/g.19120 Transcript_14312/m.19120 type:complete len:512 (+) Transcript_14312:123-1658(+)|eukprot:CAMPEP_0197301946 /NCGR_PEP_ID=MMETSP0890-20130614/50727_1 /TAXON_ID=44058 ORGANISM="Aureoumbra lagunensis, Strain CCMP1510" /NCGR_SAMPLE_ID=MMETSP0890 /ASSEMBLY_ACC=CAM_ASM_000533 /LENGTH=511 /DNA_ID=CAMNT_0042781401 /DNA_START=123 /DNA_END=1658 /DNA_ORIENTATION=-
MSDIRFGYFSAENVKNDNRALLLIGRKENLISSLSFLVGEDIGLQAVLRSATGGDEGATARGLITAGTKLRTVAMGVLPEACSRHASPARNYAVSKIVSEVVNGPLPVEDTSEWLVVILLEDVAYIGACVCALSRALPVFSAKSRNVGNKKQVTACFFTSPQLVALEASTSCAVLCRAVRECARIVDTPPEFMNCDDICALAVAVAERVKGCQISVTRGEQLRDRGYGCIYGVGKAAIQEPALVVLSHYRDGPSTGAVCLCGKGVVYDSGGLALKSKEGMCGMKMDLGGCACVLNAFEAAATLGDYTYSSLHCILAVAENAIGPNSFRNDDILTSFSSKTIEINNTDAEGRLLLADAVAHATLPDVFNRDDNSIEEVKLIIDVATLTGAQMVSTGKRVGAIVCNDERIESKASRAGIASGDLVFPLLFIPEWHQSEFKSQVADMKNSVKDRANAQCSCAATFIYQHINPSYRGSWLHIDIAGPAFVGERATGFGTGLLLALLGCSPFTSTS